MKNILVSCLESRVEQDGNIYGKFFIGPCDFGQGITLGTALRRSLLSEINGIGIVAVEIKDADHEYSSLVGVRESVLDIILNLKELALAGDILPEKPCIGFLNVSGPAEVKASHIRFPLGISAIKSDHHIATVGYDGNLSLKVFVIKGKNYMNHTPSTIRKVELLDIVSPPFFSEELSLCFARKVRDLVRIKKVFQNNSVFATSQTDASQSYATAEREFDAPVSKQTLGETSDYAFSENTDLKEKKEIFGNKVRLGRDGKIPPAHVEDYLTTEEGLSIPFYKIEPFKKIWRRNPKFIAFSQKEENLQLKLFWNENIKTDSFSPEKDEKSMYLNAFLELLGNDLNSNRKEKFSSIPSFQKKMLKSWTFSNGTLQKSRKSIPTPFYNLFKKKEKILYVSSQRKQEDRKKNKKKRSILPVDGLFGPIQRVNFRVETEMAAMAQPKDSIILEICTNGALHPRQALFESSEKLIKSFSNFSQSNPMLYGLKNSHPFVEKIKKDPSPVDFNLWTPEMDFSPKLPDIAFPASQNVTTTKPLGVDVSFASAEGASQSALRSDIAPFVSKMPLHLRCLRSEVPGRMPNEVPSKGREMQGDLQEKVFSFLPSLSIENEMALRTDTFANIEGAIGVMPEKVDEKKKELQESLFQLASLLKERMKNRNNQAVNSQQKKGSPEFPINILSSEKILKIPKIVGAVDPFDYKNSQSNSPDQLNKELTIPQFLSKLDIANLNLPLSVFVKLKNFQIHTVQHLSSHLYQGSLGSLKEDELKHLKKALEELFFSPFENKN